MISSAGKPIEKDIPSGAPSALERLIRCARDGDHEAFEALARFYWAPIYKMVYYRIRSKMDAEDITQDVFLTAFKRVSTLKEISRFRSWLFAIAINRTRDYQRKRRLFGLIGISASKGDQEIEGYEEDRGNDPLSGVAKRDFWEQVDKFLSKLSRLEKEIFVLRFMDQLNISEIAEVMGKGQSTIKTHLYRALKKFRGEERFQTFLEGPE